MSFTNQTTHYGLPQWIGSDKPTYLVDQNNAYQKIDAEIYNANTTAGAAQTAAEGAVQTAGAASTTAADALTAAQTASSTADNALTEAQTANTNAQAAQTAAGAAQTAAQAAQEAAAGNSITNLAPAYDPTITYNVDDLVTAEGKLYKCIVAVTTPEQFDINKWDDVTTSEVYAKVGSSGDVYTKAESDAKFETQTHAAATYETKTNVSNKNSLKLAVNGSGASIRFGIDSNGNYGYVKDGADTVYPFSSALNITGEVLNKDSTGFWHPASGHRRALITISALSQTTSTALNYCTMSTINGFTKTEITQGGNKNCQKVYDITFTSGSPSFTTQQQSDDIACVSIVYLD